MQLAKTLGYVQYLTHQTVTNASETNLNVNNVIFHRYR